MTISCCMLAEALRAGGLTNRIGLFLHTPVPALRACS